jgi:hypothetical protein
MDIVRFETLENKLIKIKDVLVLLDNDIADLYGVETKRINENVKKNLDKFPDKSYMIELTSEEWKVLKSDLTTSKRGGKTKPPKAFTEKGLYMLATILKSSNATQATLQIIETFAKVKELSRNINKIMKTENQVLQREFAKKSNEILEDIIEIEPDILEDDEDGEIVETTTKFEFNLGFAKVSKSIKKVKK